MKGRENEKISINFANPAAFANKNSQIALCQRKVRKESQMTLSQHDPQAP